MFACLGRIKRNEEEECHICSQCKIFQQERDKKIDECDKSRIEYEKLRQKVCQNAVYNYYTKQYHV